MLTYQPATSEQTDEFLQLLRIDAADYLERTAQLMNMTWPQFVELAKTAGRVYCVYQDGALAGFYWIEERDKVVHLHGLFVKNAYRGKGIGTQVLKMLADRYAGSMDAIELGVHESNASARTLYERLGYRTVKRLEDLGFYIMQLSLSGTRSAGEA